MMYKCIFGKAKILSISIKKNVIVITYMLFLLLINLLNFYLKKVHFQGIVNSNSLKKNTNNLYQFCENMNFYSIKVFYYFSIDIVLDVSYWYGTIVIIQCDKEDLKKCF